MEGLIASVKRLSQRIERFDINTKKSIGRLVRLEDVQARLEQLNAAWLEFQQAWNAWIVASDKSGGAPAYEEEMYDDIDDACAIARATLYGLQRKLEGPAEPQHVAIAAPADNNQHLRLPPIQPPIFAGDWDEWVSFRDMFTALVIKNTSLSNTHRLHLLRTSCIGAAAEHISGIELAEGNFKTAWDALTKRFENERLIVFRLIERLLNIPPIKKDCAEDLARLLNGTNQCIRALTVMKRDTENLDDFLVVLTVTKLDVTTRTAWERELGAEKSMPTFETLEDFLNGVLGSLEALKHLSTTSNSSVVRTQHPKRTAHTHIVAATETRKCIMCQGPHGLYNCSQFASKNVAERRKFVEEKELCFRCISTNKHRAQSCKNQFACKVCKQLHHHTLLHCEQAVTGAQRTNPFNAPSTSSANMCTTMSICNARETLLPTAIVLLTAADGRMIRLRALIDQGSQVSFVTWQAAKRLGLQRWASDTTINGISDAKAGKNLSCVQLTATSCKNKINASINVCAYILKTITADLPTTSFERSDHAAFANLEVADDQYWKSGRIDVLFGAAVLAEIIRQGLRKADGMMAQDTIFGWIMSGTAMMRPQVTATVGVCTAMQLDGLLRQFWEQEEVQRKSVLSVDDERCEQIYANTTKRRADGRYIVELPFRQGGRELGESQKGAVRRLLQMERKGKQHEQMFDGYRVFMAKYLELGHMERIPAAEIDRQPHCYLPHHAVFKPESTSTKLRVVFDATAATTNGCGLNALLLTGPRLQETLTTILMRWRGHKICFTADIEKMYRQILIAPEHQEYQRIVWRDRDDGPIEHYRLKTVTYGTASAPYMAVKTIQRLADDESRRYPIAAHVVRNDFYVDDCLSGASSVEEAMILKNQLLKLMAAGGLRLLKWSSNCKELLATLPEDHVECQAPLQIDVDDSIKALGVHWHPASDQFTYRVYQQEDGGAKSKREMLSEIAKLFDPLGLLAPVIITAKIIMQQLWLTGLGWDEELPEDVRVRWRTFKHELPQLEDIRISRWFGHTGRPHAMQLHGYCDASTSAFAACVYARVRQVDGSVVVTLLAAKTKVAPIKQQCVPRLELNGAVLLSRLLCECRQALRIDDVEMFAWTDSTVVLAWIRRHANVWQTFVANRVSEIQTNMNGTQWQHVPGVDNPADVASRGILPSELRQHPLWWTGPSWLREDPTMWPKQCQLAVDETLLEEKKTAVSHIATVKTKMFDLITRCSSWRKLLRVTARCLRILPARRCSDPRQQLTADEIEEARLTWLRLAQRHEFGDVSKLVSDKEALQRLRIMKMNPLVDGHGLLRVGGRLANANASYDELHPVILTSKNDVAQLLIRDAHERVFHSGPQATMGHLHQRYWLLNERREVRAVVHRCVTCAKSRPRLQEQQMGDLPVARVRPSRPFLHTAIDYAGPIWSRTSKGRGQKAHKSWIAVFVCLSTKAVHLELVSDLSSTAFIAAFRRFTSRRGLCTDVYCDNGTNFVGADRELKQQLAVCLRDDVWRANLAESGTNFHFSPPGSPHFNGLAEATVRMAKTAMRKVIGESTLTYEEMATLLTQIEAALNSRPLCVVPGDGIDATVLTPGHFLTGQPLIATPEPNMLDERITAANRWRLIQQMTQHFWRRWSSEYLHQLQQRQKWQLQRRNMQIGDIVCINDELTHCTRWKLGRVVATHPGSDGQVRVVTVKTSTGLLKRAVVKLSLLPVFDDGNETTTAMVPPNHNKA